MMGAIWSAISNGACVVSFFAVMLYVWNPFPIFVG